MHLYSEYNKILLEATCNKCGKNIVVFDSNWDGDNQCGNNDNVHMTELKDFECRKCKQNSYSLKLKYEYPDICEMEEDGIANVDNAFTWIRVSLKCNKCGTEYKNLIDFETA